MSVSKKSCSVVLSLVLALTLAPGIGTKAYADEVEEVAVAPQEDGSVVNMPSREVLEQSLSVLDADEGLTPRALSVDSSIQAKFFSGIDRIETSVLEARSAFPSSKYAIIAGASSWPDALAASGLSGALKCPIMLTPSGKLDDRVRQALVDMGVKNAIIVGGEPSVSGDVSNALKNTTGSTPERLSGVDRYETQMSIYAYGLKNSLWKSDLMVVASGSSDHSSDALSVSSGAYAKSSPVFLVNQSGELNEVQRNAISTGAKDKGLSNSIIVTGDENAVAKNTEVFLESVCPSGPTGVERLGGINRYKTSAIIADWMVKEGYLSWDNAAFTTGKTPYDALGGGAVQGRDGAVLLLITEGGYEAADALIANKDSVQTSVKFFGGLPSVTGPVRSYVLAGIGSVALSNTSYPITLDAMADYEVKYWGKAKDTILEGLTPLPADPSTASFYQFAMLSQGYTGLFTAAELDAYIARLVVNQESNYGVRSKLRGMGQSIIDGAKANNVNEVYLLAHAALESAWGCSRLAQGSVKGYEGYHNFFGIAAVDDNPDQGGAKKAKELDWSSPEKAMTGAAQWLSVSYINDDGFAQDTLYNMKWDLYTATHSEGFPEEYATDPQWAKNIGSVMSGFYSSAGRTPATSGLVFDVPQYLL